MEAAEAALVRLAGPQGDAVAGSHADAAAEPTPADPTPADPTTTAPTGADLSAADPTTNATAEARP
jgi:hypothetical protein